MVHQVVHLLSSEIVNSDPALLVDIVATSVCQRHLLLNPCLKLFIVKRISMHVVSHVTVSWFSFNRLAVQRVKIRLLCMPV